MTKNAITGIVLLFGISLLVRIIPAFLRLPVSAETKENIKSTLPVAVFINLLVYCMAGEIGGARAPASLSFLLLFGLLSVPKRAGLLTAVGAASICFVLLKHGLPGIHP